MNRIIHWPEGPQNGDIHSEYGYTWVYVVLPPGSTVHGVWRADSNVVVEDKAFCWNVAYVKQLLGITEDSEEIDQAVQQAMNITVSAIERYCNRKFGFDAYHHEYVYKTRGNGWQIHRWPIKSDVYIDGKKVENLTVDYQTGVLWFEGYQHREMVELHFSAGYEACEWPDDLLAVLFNSISNAYGYVQGEVTGDGVISKVTIPDVGTITYDTKSSGSISGGGSLIGGVIPMYHQSVLDFYRLHEC